MLFGCESSLAPKATAWRPALAVGNSEMGQGDLIDPAIAVAHGGRFQLPRDLLGIVSVSFAGKRLYDIAIGSIK